MKRIFIAIFTFFVFVGAHAAQVANVEYIHNLIERNWGIELPYNPELQNVKAVANMKYLLTAVDAANEILNDNKTTDYGNGEYATTQAADTTVAIQAVDTLVKKVEKTYFIITTTPDTTDFSFKISAAGNFVVDWGDGKIQNIAKENTTNTPYSHNYQIADEYKIKITGRASAYSKTANTAAVSFEYNNNIAKIDGFVGTVFGTLDNGSQPSFYATFADCKNLTSISDNLFDGVYGQPISDMFYATFDGCSSLKQIPDYLFAGLKGTLTAGLFYKTFHNCSSLSTIPTYLFGELSGDLQSKTFSNMFKGCVNLSGLSAKILSADKTFMQFLYTRWTGGNSLTVADMYNGCTGLTDYEDIPAAWK